MKLFCSLLLAVLIIHEQGFVECMRVSKWGIPLDMNRMTVSVRDLFQESMNLITDGDIYVLPDVKQRLKYLLRNSTANVMFRAYNGYLSDLTAGIVNCTEKSQLRRLIISKTPNFRKEMFTCGDCIALEATKLRFLHESYLEDSEFEAHGDIYDLSIRYWVSFQMTIESNTTSYSDCSMNLDSLHVRLDMEDWKLDLKIRSLGRMNFIADNVNEWLIDHLNGTISNNIHQTLSRALRYTASTRFMCDELFSF